MIRIGFYTPSIAFASDLPDVGIFTDHEFVDFRLTCSGATLLEGRYYADNGSVVVSDIASLVVQCLSAISELNVAELHIEAYVGEEKADYIDLNCNVLYCDRSTGLTNPEQWLRENFLSLTRSRRLAPDDFINLSWYTTEREGIMVRVYCTFINDKGQRDTYQYAHSGNGLIAHFNGIMSEVIMLHEVVKLLKEKKEIGSLVLQSVTVRCGDRSASFFIDPALSRIVPFYYLNCFGVPEHIALPRTTTEKIKSDRSIASLGTHSQFYDISHSKEYEVETGGLSRDECVQVEQMLTSPSVRIPWGRDVSVFEMDFDALLSILISDYTSEISDSDEKLNTVKFTWRFSDNRPKVELPYSPGIFNDKFNPTFS